MSSIFKSDITMSGLIKYTLPSITMQIFTSLYVIVDGTFVSRLVGSQALAATNITYPVLSVMMAIAVMFATGGSAIVAKRLGERRQEEARQSLTLLVLTALAMVTVLAVLASFFIEPLVSSLGASGTTLQYGIDYLRIYLLFIPALTLQMLFQVFFITAGKPTLGLSTTVLAGITNMVLDYVFIGPLKMGIGGAALATGLGFCIPALSGLYYFSRQVSGGQLYWVKPTWSPKVISQAISNGASELVTNISIALVTLLINYQFLNYYGDSGVAAVTIILYFQFIFMAIYMGYSFGVAPVVSFKYGEKDAANLNNIFRNSLKFLLAISALALVMSALLIDSMLHFFTQDAAVIQIAQEGFPYFAPSLAIMSIAIFASSFYTALSDGRVSAIISFLRTFIFLTLSLILLPFFMEKAGLWLATTVAEGLGLLVAIYYFAKLKNKYHYL